MKRGLAFAAVLLPLISAATASAQYYQSFSSLLQGVDPSLIISAILFVFLFAVFYFSLSKIFPPAKSPNPWLPNMRKNEGRAIPAVMALCLSALSVYGINTIPNSGNFLSNISTNIGINQGTLYTIGSLLFIGLIIFLFVKLKGMAFYIIGGIFILSAITGWTFGIIYNTSLSMIIGLASLLVGAAISWGRKTKFRVRATPQEYQSRLNRRAQARSRRQAIKHARNMYKKSKGTNGSYESSGL